MPFRSTRLCVDTRHACAHVNSDMARGFQVNSVCNIFRIPPLVYSGSTSLGEFPRFCFVKRTSQKWVHVTQLWQNCFEKAPRVRSYVVCPQAISGADHRSAGPHRLLKTSGSPTVAAELPPTRVTVVVACNRSLAPRPSCAEAFASVPFVPSRHDKFAPGTWPCPSKIPAPRSSLAREPEPTTSSILTLMWTTCWVNWRMTTPLAPASVAGTSQMPPCLPPSRPLRSRQPPRGRLRPPSRRQPSP